MDTINSGHKVAVLIAHNHRWGLGPMETSILMLIKRFCMHETSGEVWDP